MIRATRAGGPALAALLLAACQTYSQPPTMQASTPMDGNWASTDGVFYATFQGGSFISRFTQTNEILAQGTYTVVGNNVSMQWLSVQAQQQRSTRVAMRRAVSTASTKASAIISRRLRSTLPCHRSANIWAKPT